MPSLNSAVDAVLGKVDGHPASAFNEENTAVVLIEPVLAALGWDPSDLASVHRQYKVYDGTRLDYALMLDGKPMLFVEVKGVGHGLDNPRSSLRPSTTRTMRAFSGASSPTASYTGSTRPTNPSRWSTS